MSFSSEVKQEISAIELNECCVRAQLCAFFHLNATMHIVNRSVQLQIKIENASIAKRLYSLIKERYDAHVELQVIKKQNLRKNNIYAIRILEKGIEILEDLGLYSSRGVRKTPYSFIVVKECCAKAYLAGCFLASGSINSPTKPNYHLEISAHTSELAEFIVKILGKFEIDSKITVRRNKWVVYIKAADHIADFLRIVEAYDKTMEFEDQRIRRDFKNSLTRLDNCEVANEVKSIQAGSKQLDAIYVLIEHNRYNKLDHKLIEIGDLRMNHPEASLNELSEIYQQEHGVKISKSGLKHRFNKIMELADKVNKY